MRIINYNTQWREKFKKILKEGSSAYFTPIRLEIEEKRKGDLDAQIKLIENKYICYLLISGKNEHDTRANLMGYIIFTKLNNVGYTTALYIKLKFRNKGYGRLLTEVAQSKLTQLGCTKLICEVDSDNQEMLKIKFSQDYKILDIQCSKDGHQWLKLIKFI